MKKVWSVLLVTFSLLIAGCSDEDKVPADADDNFITVLTLTKDGKSYDAVIEGNDIVMTVPYTVDLNGATASMVYTPSAKILPNPQTVTDWDSEMIFRVTSFNGKENEYTYKVIKSEIESDGDVFLKSQADVDAFAETKVSVIKGNLVIGDNAENAAAINNLDALAGIKEITGSLQILNNYKGEALDGLVFTKVGGIQFGTKETESKCVDTYRFHLEFLQELTGDIEINNPKVQFVEFDNLTGISGNVYIKGDAVTVMSFPKLTKIDGDFNLRENVEMPLTQFSMPSLENVTGCFSMIKSDKLESIQLPKLNSVGSIDFNPGYGLKSLTMPEISEVKGNLSLISKFNQVAWDEYGNRNLLKFDGFSKLKSIDGVLTIACWYALEEFPNLSSVTSLGGLEVYGLQAMATQLADCCDLGNAEFKEFNGVKPYIKFGAGWITNGGDIYFKTFKTKNDLSNVNIDLSLAAHEDKWVPETNFTSVGSLTGRIEMNDVESQNTPLPLEIVKGDLRITFSHAQKKKVDWSNIKSVGGIFSFACTMAQSVDLSNLTTVGNWAMFNLVGTKGLNLSKLQSVATSAPQNINSRSISPEEREGGFFIAALCELNFPELNEIGGTGGFFQNFTGIKFPKLTTVNKIFLSTAPNCSEVNFPELKTVSNIKIEKLGKLSDFSTFATVIENGSVTDGNWEVTGCKYNPTYQDMKEGRYTPTE